MLSVEQLTTTFYTGNEQITAVDHVSFSVQKGETLAIVGESGSGKSVTALSILRLLSTNGKISDGKVIFQNSADSFLDLTQADEKHIRSIRGQKIAMIFQEPATSLNPVLRCGEQVAEVLRVHKGLSQQEAKNETIRLFTNVRLADAERIYDSYPHEVSGGQKQRVMIAMAISCHPDLLIADEATTSLDKSTETDIILLLKDLQKKYNMGMIFISHDLTLVSELADKVAVMYKGKVVEYGNSQELFNAPQHPYTKGLLACRPTAQHKYQRLPTLNDFMVENADGTVIEIFRKENSPENHFDDDVIEKLPPILVVKNLSVSYTFRKNILSTKARSIKAVDNVNLEIVKGETVGLTGASGCGKTTLGKAIMRLVEPVSGELFFDGKNYTKTEGRDLRELRKKIQIIFQDPYAALNPKMKIGEAITEPMLAHALFNSAKGRKEKAISLLEATGLKADHFNRYPAEFSGGQRQRITIARALATEPEFIICDEIVSSLDVSVQAQILNLLNDLKKDRKLTYLFISHDLTVVNYMCDRIFKMENGKLV